MQIEQNSAICKAGDCNKQLADPLEVLTIRAEARAYLWSTFDILYLPDAIDPLQNFALKSGLVAAIGQDRVQQIIGDAFAIYWRAPDA